MHCVLQQNLNKIFKKINLEEEEKIKEKEIEENHIDIVLALSFQDKVNA